MSKQEGEVNLTINNDSDINITCSRCGSCFASRASYHKELIEMYLTHLESHV